jgi:hypothetical protein
MIAEEHECIEWPVSNVNASGCTDEGNTWHATGCPSGYVGTCSFGNSGAYGYAWRVYEGADLATVEQACEASTGTWSTP